MDFEVVLLEIHEEDVSEVDVGMRGEVEKEVVVVAPDGRVGNHDLVTVVAVGFYNNPHCIIIGTHLLLQINFHIFLETIAETVVWSILYIVAISRCMNNPVRYI